MVGGCLKVTLAWAVPHASSYCLHQDPCLSHYLAACLNHSVWDLCSRVIIHPARRHFGAGDFSYQSLVYLKCVPRSTARLSCCFITTSQGFLKEHNFFGSSTKHSLLGGELEDLFSILRGLFSIPHWNACWCPDVVQSSFKVWRIQPGEQHMHAQPFRLLCN